MEGARDRICIALDTCADQNLGGLRTLVKRIRESSGHLRSQGVSRAKVPWAHDISGCSVGSTHPLLQTACVAASLELRASGQVECMARMLNHRHWLRSQGKSLAVLLPLAAYGHWAGTFKTFVLTQEVSFFPASPLTQQQRIVKDFSHQLYSFADADLVDSGPAEAQAVRGSESAEAHMLSITIYFSPALSTILTSIACCDCRRAA